MRRNHSRAISRNGSVRSKNQASTAGSRWVALGRRKRVPPSGNRLFPLRLLNAVVHRLDDGTALRRRIEIAPGGIIATKEGKVPLGQGDRHFAAHLDIEGVE